MTMRRVCVFCGASPGHDPVYADAAASLGRVVGPVLGSGVASVAGLSAPFAVGAVICLGGTLLVASRPTRPSP